MRLPILLCQFLHLQFVFPQLNNKPFKDRNYEFYFSLVSIRLHHQPDHSQSQPTHLFVEQKSEENKHAEYIKG